jgi:hypothetical protein
MKGYSGVAAATLSLAGASPHILDQRRVNMHELAHCNGWDHPTFGKVRTTGPSSGVRWTAESG